MKPNPKDAKRGKHQHNQDSRQSQDYRFVQQDPRLQQNKDPHGHDKARQEQPRFYRITNLRKPWTDPDVPPPAFDSLFRPSIEWQVFLLQSTLLSFLPEEMEISTSLVALIKHHEGREGYEDSHNR